MTYSPPPVFVLLVSRRLRALSCAAALLGASACQSTIATRCADKSPIAAAAIVDRITEKMARTHHIPIRNDEIEYKSGVELQRVNPNCCWFADDRLNANRANLNVPLHTDNKLFVVYRRLKGGDRPYYLARFEFDTCPDKYETSGSYISEAEYKAITKRRSVNVI